MDVDRRLQDFSRKVDQFDIETNQSSLDGPDLTGIHHRVKIALSLYKVQQNIYLLDFQRLDVSIYLFTYLCMYCVCIFVDYSFIRREMHLAS